MTDVWRGTNVLITGIAGFVGAHLARRLVDLGAHVAGVDLVATSPCLRTHNLDVPIYKASLTDPADTQDVLSAGRGPATTAGGFVIGSLPHPPDVIFHLAGRSHISDSQQHPFEAFQANVRTTYTLLDVCRRSLPDLRAVVVASSNHVYGRKGYHRESDPLAQLDVYGASKACVDLITRTYGASFGVPAVALRHVNCFGEANPHPHITTATVLSVLRGERPIIKSDGTPRKGYLHVSDVVSAYLTLAEHAQAVKGRAFNAGAYPISVLELVRTIIRVAGSSMEPIIEASDLTQSGYVEWLDDAALRGLGWAPRVDLDEGLARTIGWYREHGGMAWTI